MKSLTLSILPLTGQYISGWEASECDTWPHKRPRLAKECQRRFHACNAHGFVSETSISYRFFINTAILFLFGRREARKDSQTFVFHPPLLPPFFVAFVRKKKKKTAKVKSPQSTSNRRSSPFLLTLAALWLLWPAFPLSNSDVGHFTFVTSKTQDCP